MPAKSPKPLSRKKLEPIPVQFVYEALRERFGPVDGIEITDSLDLVIFGHLALHLPLDDAVRAYQRFKSQFVDWNEVRISTAKDVQEVLKSGDEPLELAIFIKEFLNRLFVERHQIGLEFLRDLSLSEIRGFFKPVSGVSESTVNLLLAHLKDYPVLPLESWMEPCVQRLGLANGTCTSLQRQKDLFEMVAREHVFPLYLYLLELAREVCVLDDSRVDCPRCSLSPRCPSAKNFARKRARSAKSSVRKNGAAKKTTNPGRRRAR